jgi:hypothetical protein
MPRMRLICKNKLSIRDKDDLGFGIWDLGFGIWDLGFGIWDLGFGIWYFKYYTTNEKSAPSYSQKN